MKKCRGSFTLEATIVISSVLIILCAVFFAFMLLYQNVVISYSASYAASEGARAWVVNRESDSRYWRLKEFGTITSGAKINEIKSIAENKLTQGVIANKGNQVNVKYENSFGTGKITVEIAQDLNVPFQGIAKFFNGGKPLQLKAKATANVAEPTEYIRNIDYGVEWISSISNWLGKKVGEKLEGNKAVETISALFGL